MSDLRIDVTNASLALIGESAIASFDDSRTAAVVAAAIYEETLRGALGNADWDFAKRQQAMNRLAETPVDLWDAAYQLPVNPPLIKLRRVTVSDLDIPYDRYQDRVFCNAGTTETVIAHYIYRPAEDLWTGSFRIAFIHELAAAFALAIAEDEGKAEMLGRKAMGMWARARSLDSQSSTTNRIKTRFRALRR